MARPSSMQAGRPVRLYLPHGLIRAADRLAFQKNMSLSAMVRTALEKIVKRADKKTKGRAA